MAWIKQKPENENKRYDELKKAFKDKYNYFPTFYARAPGRVNLIGEHIDYCGYSVLPIAIEQDIVAAVGFNEENTLRLSNLDPRYEDVQTNVNSFEIDKLKPLWFHYFLCGFQGLTETLNKEPVGIDVFLHGIVPKSAGLSSSSALVCAAGLATMHANGADLAKVDLATICTDCERYIGTQGGGMDQSISLMAQKGTAKLIEFNPLRSTDVILPDGIVFVVSNSCVELNKAATSHFNTRVVECRLAAQMIAKKNNLDFRKFKKLGDVQNKLNIPLDDMVELVSNLFHPEPYTKDELCKILEVTEEELEENSLSHNTKHVNEFKLLNRSMHVYSEASRVLKFKDTCDKVPNAAAQTLGNLMFKSYVSCRDQYECSCPELDELVDICMSAGALGSRLTGAGWGGCAVSLVPENSKDKFIAKVTEDYYVKHNLKEKVNEALFVTEPGDGACIYLA